MTNIEAFPEIIKPAPFVTGYADPPWPERGGGKVKRGADRHYPLMSVKAICELPVARLFQENAHLYLWATNNYLPAALEVMAVWGFRYVSTITWGKVLNKANASYSLTDGGNLVGTVAKPGYDPNGYMLGVNHVF